MRLSPINLETVFLFFWKLTEVFFVTRAPHFLQALYKESSLRNLCSLIEFSVLGSETRDSHVLDKSSPSLAQQTLTLQAVLGLQKIEQVPSSSFTHRIHQFFISNTLLWHSSIIKSKAYSFSIFPYLLLIGFLNILGILCHITLSCCVFF